MQHGFWAVASERDFGGAFIVWGVSWAFVLHSDGRMETSSKEKPGMACGSRIQEACALDMAYFPKTSHEAWDGLMGVGEIPLGLHGTG